MTTTSEDGGPAFPRVGEGFGNPRYDAAGMSLRDYFAGQALAGAAGEEWYVNVARKGAAALDMPPERYVAAACYRMADAMIAARSSSTDSRRT